MITRFAKISRGGERFWVRVKGFDNEHITGTVDNHTNVPGCRYGDELRFHISEVIDWLESGGMDC